MQGCHPGSLSLGSLVRRADTFGGLIGLSLQASNCALVRISINIRWCIPARLCNCIYCSVAILVAWCFSCFLGSVSLICLDVDVDCSVCPLVWCCWRGIYSSRWDYRLWSGQFIRFTRIVRNPGNFICEVANVILCLTDIAYDRGRLLTQCWQMLKDRPAILILHRSTPSGVS